MNTFATTDASAFSHGVVEVEDDFAVSPSERESDDVIMLHIATSLYAESARDARVEVDVDGGMRGVCAACFPGGIGVMVFIVCTDFFGPLP